MCMCVHVVNALHLRLTTNQSDGWQVPHKRTEIKQISVEIKQTFPQSKAPLEGQGGCIALLSVSHLVQSPLQPLTS